MKPDVISHIGPLIEGARNHVIDVEEDLRKQHSDWKANTDARLTIFNKCSSVLATVSINLVLLEQYLSKEDWWKNNSSIPLSEDSIKVFLQEFEMFNRIGLVHFIFASIESSFRLFLSALDAAACSSGRAEFKSVYDCLLSKVNLKEYIGLLDIWRNIRNCLHNNGLFFPKNNRDQNVSYKSWNYTFKVGKPLDFINTTEIVVLLPEVIEMLSTVVKSQEISNIKKIIDLTAR